MAVQSHSVRRHLFSRDDEIAGVGESERASARLGRTLRASVADRRPEGISAAPFEQGEIGPDLFRAACNMGLEGLVSKRRDRAYRAGRCAHWIKVKNPKHPSMACVKESFSRRP